MQQILNRAQTKFTFISNSKQKLNKPTSSNAHNKTALDRLGLGRHLCDPAFGPSGSPPTERFPRAGARGYAGSARSVRCPTYLSQMGD